MKNISNYNGSNNLRIDLPSFQSSSSGNLLQVSSCEICQLPTVCPERGSFCGHNEHIFDSYNINIACVKDIVILPEQNKTWSVGNDVVATLVGVVYEAISLRVSHACRNLLGQVTFPHRRRIMAFADICL